jgi:hypothetical protein
MFLLIPQFRPETLQEYADETSAALSLHQTFAYHRTLPAFAIRGVRHTDERKTPTGGEHYCADGLAPLITIQRTVYSMRHRPHFIIMNSLVAKRPPASP